MRFNERELRVIGRSPGNSEKEGRLLYRKSYSSKGHLGAYKEKWFRLRGNLLFYFKITDPCAVPDTDPKGVFVLERCKIQHEPFSDRIHVFSIAFQDDSAEKKHYFSGPSQAQTEEWVTMLRKASYEQLRATLTILQAQILKLTGQDPMEAFRHNIMSVMKQAGEGIDPKPELRDKEDGQRANRRDSRRKGVSAQEAELIFSDLIDIDISNSPLLDMPITPIHLCSDRKRRQESQEITFGVMTAEKPRVEEKMKAKFSTSS